MNRTESYGESEQVKRTIVAAFAHEVYPGDWCLRGSDEGDEPYLTVEEFAGKTDWRTLDAEFLDQAPDGLGSALSFLSDEAFRFYLPAYLIADIDGKLKSVDPVFYLTHGLTDARREVPVNPRRYGGRTWFDEKSHKFSMFSPVQAAAIIAYLRFRAARGELDRGKIDEALRNYWFSRTSS